MNKLMLKFKNEDEERKFWETHDSTEFINWDKAKKVRPVRLAISA
jgi:hypothetical protein